MTTTNVPRTTSKTPLGGAFARLWTASIDRLASLVEGDDEQ